MPLIETTALRETLQNLASMPPTEFPFVSAYIDLSPELDRGTRAYTNDEDDAYKSSGKQNQGQDRGPQRPGIRDMHDRLRYKGYLFAATGSERESYDADKKRITEFLERDEFDSEAKGVAIFACAGQEIWEVVEIGVAVPTRVYVARTPLIFPLAQVMEDYERFAFVITETSSAHIYVVGLGQTEVDDTIRGPKVNRTQKGDWSQARYQRRQDNAMSGHIKEIADRLASLVTEENIPRIVLSGDVTSITNFKNHLPDEMLVRVVAFESSQANTPLNEAIAHATDLVMQAEKEDARDLARQARDAALAENLGTFGEHSVRYALMQGAVHVLVMASNFSNTMIREEFTEAALATSATVDFIEDSEDLRRMHGVAAVLRFRPDGLPDHPQMRQEDQVVPEDESDEAALLRRRQEMKAAEQNDGPAHPTPNQAHNPKAEMQARDDDAQPSESNNETS